ncbi:MAG: XdhC family protein [Candidatus Flexifilum sp.]|jgi:xanthine dehydrogenase accessory factor
MDDTLAVYEAVIAAHRSGEPAALCTVTQVQGSVPRHAGSKLLMRADGSFVGTVGGGRMEALVLAEAQSVIASGQARTVTYSLNDIGAGDPGICGGTVQVFIEPIVPTPTLLVIGMGHVGKATAELGQWMGYRVIACDDRPEYASPDFVPGLAGYVVCRPGDVVTALADAGMPITGTTYVAAVTRGLPVDIDLIPALLQTPAPYIGLIGSERRWALTKKALLTERGLTEAQIARVHAPIGLELQAETPREIALSILAEIVMLRRGGSGISMSRAAQVNPAHAETSP